MFYYDLLKFEDQQRETQITLLALFTVFSGLVAHVAFEPFLLYQIYGMTPADINCDGCQSESPRLFNYCNICEIRKCARAKQVATCAACPEYSCKKLDDFLAQVPEARAILKEIRKAM